MVSNITQREEDLLKELENTKFLIERTAEHIRSIREEDNTRKRIEEVIENLSRGSGRSVRMEQEIVAQMSRTDASIGIITTQREFVQQWVNRTWDIDSDRNRIVIIDFPSLKMEGRSFSKVFIDHTVLTLVRQNPYYYGTFRFVYESLVNVPIVFVT